VVAVSFRIKTNDLDLPEITSSGLTHTWGEYREEPNKHRIGKLIVSLNFGLLHIDWRKPAVTFEIRNQNNKILLANELW
jgi:alkaline phosphatase D